MRTLIAEVQSQIEGYEHFYKTRQNKRRPADLRTFERMIEAIICDLSLVELSSDVAAVHIPRSNKVLRKPSRYKGEVLSGKLPDLLDIMAAPEMAFVEMTPGSQSFKLTAAGLRIVPTGGTQTTLAPGAKLVSRIARFGITASDIAPSLDQEPIVLRTRKKPRQDTADLVEYTDTPETQRLRKEMQDINAWLAQADIECGLSNVHAKNRFLRRIFNNDTFEEGGRLYGGFWQVLSSNDRLTGIAINDDGVAECDYGQMSLMLLYAEAGETPPKGDLYDLSEYGIPTDCRKGIKKVIQAIINSPKLPTRMPGGARKHFPKRYTVKKVIEAVRLKHDCVFDLMTSNAGLRLFRTESDILVEVLLTLRDQGVVALPIHDGVVVADKDREKTIQTMKSVFKKQTGITPVVHS
ncbi:hypothetical protein HKCCSP123_04430 [Rhodobacterales bacterium HKCCSP123]|nr:hypothetical protein [Rhodobacterales bacterium HKCCSP123]